MWSRMKRTHGALKIVSSVCITCKLLCTAGLYAAHDPYHVRTLSLPCVKLPLPVTLRWEGVVRLETKLHTRPVSSSLVYTVFVGKAPIRAFCVHVYSYIADCVLSYRCIYYVVIFCCLSIAFQVLLHQNCDKMRGDK